MQAPPKVDATSIHSRERSPKTVDFSSFTEPLDSNRRKADLATTVGHPIGTTTIGAIHYGKYSANRIQQRKVVPVLTASKSQEYNKPKFKDSTTQPGALAPRVLRMPTPTTTTAPTGEIDDDQQLDTSFGVRPSYLDLEYEGNTVDIQR